MEPVIEGLGLILQPYNVMLIFIGVLIAWWSARCRG